MKPFQTSLAIALLMATAAACGPKSQPNTGGGGGAGGGGEAALQQQEANGNAANRQAVLTAQAQQARLTAQAAAEQRRAGVAARAGATQEVLESQANLARIQQQLREGEAEVRRLQAQADQAARVAREAREARLAAEAAAQAAAAGTVPVPAAPAPVPAARPAMPATQRPVAAMPAPAPRPTPAPAPVAAAAPAIPGELPPAPGAAGPAATAEVAVQPTPVAAPAPRAQGQGHGDGGRHLGHFMPFVSCKGEFVQRRNFWFIFGSQHGQMVLTCSTGIMGAEYTMLAEVRGISGGIGWEESISEGTFRLIGIGLPELPRYGISTELRAALAVGSSVEQPGRGASIAIGRYQGYPLQGGFTLATARVEGRGGAVTLDINIWYPSCSGEQGLIQRLGVNVAELRAQQRTRGEGGGFDPCRGHREETPPPPTQEEQQRQQQQQHSGS